MLTNEYVYDIMPTLKPTDGYVLLYLLARTHGFKVMTRRFTLDSIATACHISRSQARISLRLLDKLKYIKILGKDTDNPNPLMRGLIIEVLVARPETKAGAESKPRSDYVPRSKYQPIKQRDYKREDRKSAPPSAEDLEEAKRYGVKFLEDSE